MGRSDAELSLVLTGDGEMRKLNRLWRGKDRTTDVLSFPLEGERKTGRKGGKVPLGDIVISVPTAAAQARQLGVTLGQEASRLLVHGLLHLVGYDHERSPREAARMLRMEDRLLEGMD